MKEFKITTGTCKECAKYGLHILLDYIDGEPCPCEVCLESERHQEEK
jgi:hypothetical protein|tara:strand:- start:681 stop:821 length:141 start_codon:yes stop_codon:yes gene_type:complete